jgi:signal transduction histidine kinase
MSSSADARPLGFDALPRLDQLVDRPSLHDVLETFYVLFRVAVRVFDAEGALVGDALDRNPHAICQYVDRMAAGRIACEATVAAAKGTVPPLDSECLHPCFTGASYRIFSITMEGRSVGRVVLGPYLPAETREPPRSLLRLAPQVDASQAWSALDQMPRLTGEQASALTQHLRSVLEVMVFAGHRALVTSQVHVGSIREAYRELKAKNAELARSYERLQELDRLKSNFLATVSHELKTPLTSIIGYSEMLSEGIGGALTGEQQEFVRVIRERGEQLLSLITSLLDLAKLEQGTAIPIAPGSVSLAALATEVAATFLPNARRKGVQLKVLGDPNAPDARGDRERLRQVLTNLVDNALKFTPAGGEVSVHVRPVPPLDGGTAGGDEPGLAILGPAAQDVELRVSDTGVGIPPSEQDRVFDAFYQVDSGTTRAYGGAGLGLAIVKRIVESHGGRIFIEPDGETTGTTVVVQLPALRG